MNAAVSPTQIKILVPGNHLMVDLLGERDELLRLIEKAFGGVEILVRGNEISISGDKADQVGHLFEELVLLLQRGQRLDAADIGRTIDMVKADERPSEVLAAEVLRSSRGRTVRPKTSGQRRYADAIAANVITFGIGPAGTGKSYLAVALAVQALQAKQVERIILTRPAVEAGERLGFLPGTLMEKVDPYLRPLYDALYDMLPAEQVERRIASGKIEIAPIAFMRGRTLANAVVLLDEAQNTTSMQMKMFLTRLGEGSRMIVNGDPTQIDLPPGQKSGLNEAVRILSGVEGIARIVFREADVVRHDLVRRIVTAWEADTRKGLPEAGARARAD